MTTTGELPIPTQGGATSLETLARITALEQELADLKRSVASDTAYGLAKVTNATDVTEEIGIAISAVQNNASVSGSLRYEIEQVNKNLVKRKKLFRYNGIIQDEEIITLSSGDYHALEVWYSTDIYSGRNFSVTIPGSNNIFLSGVGVEDQTEYRAYILSRFYYYQSPTTFKAAKANLRRFNGTFEQSADWLNIYEIWGLTYNV